MALTAQLDFVPGRRCSRREFHGKISQTLFNRRDMLPTWTVASLTTYVCSQVCNQSATDLAGCRMTLDAPHHVSSSFDSAQAVDFAFHGRAAVSRGQSHFLGKHGKSMLDPGRFPFEAFNECQKCHRMRA